MKPKSKVKVAYKHEQNPQYRQIHADGAWGGLNPLGELNLSFYATKFSAPDQVSYDVDSNGNIDPESAIETGFSGLIREVEFGVYMSKEAGESLYQFLKNIYEPNKK